MTKCWKCGYESESPAGLTRHVERAHRKALPWLSQDGDLPSADAETRAVLHPISRAGSKSRKPWSS